MGQDRVEELKNAPGVKEVEEEKPKLFSMNCGILQDLDDWSSKLEALGWAISFLGEVNQGEGLDFCGQQLGNIIEDYAKAIKVTLEDKEIRKALGHKGSDLFFLSDHQEVYEMIKQGAYSPEIALILVNKEIEQVDSFLESNAGKTYDLHANLVNLRKAVVERIEKEKDVKLS